MEETATKPVLPIHAILGVNEYIKIKMSGYRTAGEQTRFGWTIMTTGAEVDLQHMFLTQTAISDYEELCRLDVLGIQVGMKLGSLGRGTILRCLATRQGVLNALTT